LSQALGSFVLQALAARELGAAGLGAFSLMYGAILLGTAITSGLIGDSLTVLARDDRWTRAALQNWCVIVSAVAGIVAVTAGVASGALTVGTAVAFGAVTFVFIVEDAMRRALMAVFFFWRLPIVDFASLIGSLAYLGIVRAGGGTATLGQFLVALLVGQAIAAVVAVPLLPPHERPIRLLRSHEMGTVFGFGAWRAAQQSVRPGALTAARIIVTLLISVAAYGKVEAARVYMAPAILIVSGLGSMMLPMWVRRRHDGLSKLIRRADIAAGGLWIVTLTVGAIGTAALPVFGGLLTDGKYHIQAGAVFGWAVYAAATAAVTPYGTLAALQGRQGRVMLMRLVEPVIGLAVLALVLGVAGGSATLTPYVLGLGALASGLGIRLLILPRMLSTETEGVHRASKRAPRHRATTKQFSREYAAQVS
jgi:O-antigen/teichoic acid export membrane protein